MKNVIVFIIGILLFSIISCTEKKFSNEIVDIDDNQIPTQNVELSELQLNDEELSPNGLCLVDSFLVVLNDNMSKDMISIYCNNKLMSRFGNIGNGESDFINPIFLMNNGQCVSNKLSIASLTNYKVYDIKDLIDSNFNKYEYHDIPTDYMILDRMYLDNDSIAILTKSKNQLFIHNKIDNTYKDLNFIDDYFINDMDTIYYIMGVYYFHSNSNENNIIFAYDYFKMIDIIDMNGNLKKRLRFTDYDINKDKFIYKNKTLSHDYENLKNFFGKVIIQPDCFFVFCIDDYNKNLNAGISKSSIYKIDYSGNVLKKYIFDFPIMSGIIKDNIFYGVGYKLDEELKFYYGNL